VGGNAAFNAKMDEHMREQQAALEGAQAALAAAQQAESQLRCAGLCVCVSAWGVCMAASNETRATCLRPRHALSPAVGPGSRCTVAAAVSNHNTLTRHQQG
jgi:hypothetical protein